MKFTALKTKRLFKEIWTSAKPYCSNFFKFYLLEVIRKDRTMI